MKERKLISEEGRKRMREGKRRKEGEEKPGRKYERGK